MAKKFSVPRGTHDILPEEIPQWHLIEQKAEDLLRRFGYRELRTPLFESTGLFTRSLGQGSEIVNKQLLKLESSKEDGFSLRPEATASIVRAYIENGIDRKENLTRYFYIGPMFRGERPQKGRLRQFHQIGVEVIGPAADHPFLDAEVIALNVSLLKAFGLNDFQVKLNTLGTFDNKRNIYGLLEERLQPKLKDLCGDCKTRVKRNVFRVLDCKNKSCQSVVKGIGLGYDWLDDESREYFSKVKEALDNLGIQYEEVPSLVRGLDYYTHTVFEITSPSLGSQDAISAGGRYNHLVGQLGGPEVPAIGFALGIERTLLAIAKSPKSEAVPLSTYIIALDEKSFKMAFQILSVLRQEGVSSDMSYRIASMKSQMRSANKSGARSVVIIGEAELEKKIVTLKDMETSHQEEVAVSDNDATALAGQLKERYQ